MISVVLTLSKDPIIAEKSVKAILKNNVKEDCELIILISDNEKEKIIKKFKKDNFKIIVLKNTKRDTRFNLNNIFKILNGRIWIFTGGNAYVDEDSLLKIIKAFSDKKVGCVVGRPVSINKKTEMLGFWSHLLFEAGAHAIRKKLGDKGKFLEGTDYLFAFKNNITRNVPLNVAMDSIIPYLTTKKGYKIKYLEEAKVFVENPTILKNFINQKIKAAKSHEYLESYAPFFPKMKSFRNEIKMGTFEALRYSSNFKEFFWTIALFFIRLYIWIKVKIDTKILKKNIFSSNNNT